MFYSNELQFLCDVFGKSHVSVISSPIDELCDRLSEDIFYPSVTVDDFLAENFGSMESKTVYRITDAYYRRFICLLLPDTHVSTVLFIGPFLSAPVSREDILMIGEDMGAATRKQKYLNEYYSSLPVIPPDGSLMIMLNTFFELIWQSPSFAIVDVEQGRNTYGTPLRVPESAEDVDYPLLNMKTMEMRYTFENELLRAVSLGQIHAEARLMSAFSAENFEKRAADPLRNAKNYCIIMNTLLRKAAEKGGVHPVYLDDTSSAFAKRIEGLSSLVGNADLMRDMFREYCYLVRRHALRNFSSVVRKIILLVDSDLSVDLSPGALAERLRISLSYLSAVFSRETGKTLSTYVREKRIEYAAELLATTDLQIQTVASYCGIMDVQYFSKLFKKQMSKTPTEYRLSVWGRTQSSN